MEAFTSGPTKMEPARVKVPPVIAPHLELESLKVDWRRQMSLIRLRCGLTFELTGCIESIWGDYYVNSQWSHIEISITV